MIQQRSDFNVSPELLAQLKLKAPSPSYNPEKEDVFALGLTALKLALLRGEDIGIYDEANFAFKGNILQERLEQVSNKYFPELASLIEDMMRLNPNERPGYQELEARTVYLLQNGEHFEGELEEV